MAAVAVEALVGEGWWASEMVRSPRAAGSWSPESWRRLRIVREGVQAEVLVLGGVPPLVRLMRSRASTAAVMGEDWLGRVSGGGEGFAGAARGREDGWYGSCSIAGIDVSKLRRGFAWRRPTGLVVQGGIGNAPMGWWGFLLLFVFLPLLGEGFVDIGLQVRETTAIGTEEAGIGIVDDGFYTLDQVC